MKTVFRSLFAVLCLALSPVVAGAEESPEVVEGAVTVSVDDAYALFEDGAVFVDVRKPSDFENGHIPGAVHLDLKATFTETALADVVGKADPVVIYCNGWSCLRSAEASAMAVSWGYQNVQYLRDGFPGWDAAAFPIE